MIDRKQIILGAKCELARRSFFDFCNIKAPDFYKPERKYLVTLCGEMQSFIEDYTKTVLLINLPPRFGKSRTATLLTQWIFGKDKTKKVMTGSYNETLSTTFSKAVRNGIQEVKADPLKIVYSDIFPDVRIQYGDAAANLWSLEGSYSSYLATSPTGTATGFGADIEILDDLIKSAYEANNESILDNHWNWFTDTMLSRLEKSGKIICIMTRWNTRDLSGRLLEYYKDKPDKIKVITMKALQNDGSMLCEEILDKTTYDAKMKLTGKSIFLANYQQQPIDEEGKLYSSFKTYNAIPVNDKGEPLFVRIMSYCDTADTGEDYLCSLVFGVYNQEAYMLDALYSQAPMEITEEGTARQLFENNVMDSMIESNNGGRGFARSVERILKDKYQTNRPRIQCFHQKNNKISRILTTAPWIMQHMYFPRNWGDKWPDFYMAMNSYQRAGKNKHDDAPDAVTGCYEFMRASNLVR